MDCHGTGYSNATVARATHVDGTPTLNLNRTGCVQCHGLPGRTGVLAIAVFRAWRELNWIAFALTFGVMGAWAFESYTPAAFVVGQGFLAAFWLLFLGVSLNMQGVVDAALGGGRAEGFRGFKVNKGVEHPDRYVLMIFWDTLEDHTVGFRGSPAFAQWRAIVGPFFAAPPERSTV